MSRAGGRPQPAGGALSDPLLSDARAWVQAGRASAIERFPYLDVALSSMIPVAVMGLGTVATDVRWRFYFDPGRVQTIPEDERLEVMVSDWVHEVGHLLRDHAQRWHGLGDPARNHPVFNVAGDALINQDLADLGLRILPTDITFDRLPGAAEVEPGMITEEIYRRLLEHCPPAPRPEGASGDGEGDAGLPLPQDCGSGAGGERRPWELPLDDAPTGSPTVPDDGSVDGGRADLIRHETAEQIRSHVRTHGTGAIPHRLRAWAESVLDPIVDWRRELRAAVSRGLSQAAGRADYSWSRPPRRRVPGYTTPGMAAPEPPRVAVVVDTSGSMSPDDLAQCIADIAALTRSVAGSAGGTPVSVIPCDVKVGPVSLVRGRADVRDLQLTGGGGTDMGVGLTAASELSPTPDVIVTLTDGYTPWPPDPPAGAPRARYIAVVVNDEQGEILPDVPQYIHTISRS